jgi:hypothetical protein
MGLVARVDRAADLGHPQRHAVMGKQRERAGELAAVKRPLRLAHHHGVEPPARIGERREQGPGL